MKWFGYNVTSDEEGKSSSDEDKKKDENDLDKSRDDDEKMNLEPSKIGKENVDSQVEMS